MKRFIKNKKGIEFEMLAYWLIALTIFVVVLAGYFILKAKGISAIDFFKNLMKF